MSYLVMECHPAYAVVLDEEGRFLKTANFHYRPGQKISQIEELKTPDNSRKIIRYLSVAASAAACLCLMAAALLNFVVLPYGTVRIQINPDVQLTVNRLNYVIDAQGMNPDGKALLDGWDYSFQKADEASGQLARRAAEQGYLKDNGTVHFAVASGHSQWKNHLEGRLITALNSSTSDSVTVIPDAPEETEDFPVEPDDESEEDDDRDDNSEKDDDRDDNSEKDDDRDDNSEKDDDRDDESEEDDDRDDDSEKDDDRDDDSEKDDDRDDNSEEDDDPDDESEKDDDRSDDSEEDDDRDDNSEENED